MDDVFKIIFLQIKDDMLKLRNIDKVIGIKEAADILEIPERTLRSRVNSGEFDEEKGEIRRLSTSNIVFDREAIENRKFMKKEIYWELKEKYDRCYDRKPAQKKVEDSYIEIKHMLREILKEVKK